MNTTLRIEGMSCNHCLSAVESALKAVPGVQDATVNLNEGTATVTHDQPVALSDLIAAVDEAGYQAEAQ